METEQPKDMTDAEAREWVRFLREALEYYSCGENCPEPKMKDGQCVREAAGGWCGKVARDALNRVGRE